MTKNIVFAAVVLFAAIAVVASAQTATVTVPCFVSQITVGEQADVAVAPGGSLYPVIIRGVPSHQGNCSGIGYDVDAFVLPVLYIVQRWDGAAYTDIRSLPVQYRFDGTGRDVRKQMWAFDLLQGSYRVLVNNGNALIESLPFTVGSLNSGPVMVGSPVVLDDMSKLAYGQPSALTDASALYFRGSIPNTTSVTGYLYQDLPDTTVVVPAQFQVATSGFATQSFVRGGTFDLPMIKAVVPAGNYFDWGRKIYGCPTVNGVTGCFPIFDPASPIKNFTQTAAPFAVNSAR